MNWKGCGRNWLWRNRGTASGTGGAEGNDENLAIAVIPADSGISDASVLH
jgi:hypothetical protein